MTTYWTCADGERIEGDLFPAQAPRALAVIAPAMGVPRRFYRRFAGYLAGCGITAVTFDYRNRPGTRMADWGRLDLEAVLAARDRHLPLFLIGHSCGGQLAGLAPSARHLHGVVLVAAQTAYWRHWRGREKARMWLLWHVLVPLLAQGRRFPARRLGLFSLDVPASVIRQWRAWACRSRYLFDPGFGLDTGLYRRLEVPALAYGFDDDAYAPVAAVDALLAEYPRLAVTRRQTAPADVRLPSIGHMGFFRQDACDAFWRPTAQWLLDTAGDRARGAIRATG